MYFMYICLIFKIVIMLFDIFLNVLEFSDVLVIISVFLKVLCYLISGDVNNNNDVCRIRF